VLRDALIAHLDKGTEVNFKTRYADRVTVDAWKQHAERRHGGTPLREMFMASLQLSDGNWLNFAAPVEAPQPFWSVRFALSLVVMIVAVFILSALVVRRLTKPLAIFARAANRLGVDVNAPALSEAGPAEVRQATRAFNEMQRRLKRFVEDRMQMVAAIAHDLGTPITRLRLRAEFIEEKHEREKMLSDLDDMEKMVFSTLSFARDEASSEPRSMVDFSTLLQRVHNDLADAGHPVTLTLGSGAVPYACQPVALRRALTNLIENAVKYGQSARVQLIETVDSVLIRIDDEGPGIPKDRQADVFKPFLRLERSRSRETGGTGLGLTVARTIVRGHGGDITLQNRPEGGLRVEVTLPRVRP